MKLVEYPRKLLEEIMKKRMRNLSAGFCAVCYLFCLCPGVLSFEHYAIARETSPVLNIPDIRQVFGGADGRTLAADDNGAVRALEFIALPGTLFQVRAAIDAGGETVYQVETRDYPCGGEAVCFVPERFLQNVSASKSERLMTLDSAEEILGRMRAWEGLPYVWGGNVPDGVPGVLSYFSVRPDDPRELLDQWMLKGLDCSGLLYAASDGWTPRNTSMLVDYDRAVAVEGLSEDEIVLAVRPLDVIVWKGHVVIVLDEGHVIESRMDHEPEVPGQQGGVRVRMLGERLKEILEERRPVNEISACADHEECFVIRRWHEDEYSSELF